MAEEPERGARKRVRHACGYELVTEVGDVFGADWNRIRRDLGLYVPEDDRGAAVVWFYDPGANMLIVYQCPGCGKALSVWWPLC